MNGVDTLNAMIAVAMDGAATLAKGVDIIKDPRIKSLLSELAAERESMVAELQDEVRALGGTPEDRGTAVGSAHRLYTEVKLALAPNDRRAVIEEMKRSEARVREKLQVLLADDMLLPPTVRAVIERHAPVSTSLNWTANAARSSRRGSRDPARSFAEAVGQPRRT
jgi:uncharacterized protein (TIGR02284 family)